MGPRTIAVCATVACALGCWPPVSDGEVTLVDEVFRADSGAPVTPLAKPHASGIRPGGFCGAECSLSHGELEDPWTLSSELGGDPPVNIGGWFQAGYHNCKDGTFNNDPHHLQLHQGWLFVERVAEGSTGLALGGRIDVVYGTDGPNTQSFGNTPGVFDYSDTFNRGEGLLESSHGWAVPQLYGEAAYGDWNLRLGHFFTLLGYEVVPSTGNFFYSRAFTMNYSEAFTHTGAVVTYAGVENVELYGGCTLGWDTGFDQFDGGSSFLGGFRLTPVEDIVFTYITTAGNLGWAGRGYSHSVVMAVDVTERLQFVTQSDFIHTSGSDVIGKDFDTIGWNNYLIYRATDRIGLGGRAEWWKAQGVSYYEMTAGLNFKPNANMVVRPEFRYQWAPAAGGSGDVNPIGIPTLEQGIFGVDALLTF